MQRQIAQEVLNNVEHGGETQKLVDNLQPNLGIENPSRHFVSDPTNYFYNMFKNIRWNLQNKIPKFSSPNFVSSVLVFLSPLQRRRVPPSDVQSCRKLV